MFGEKRPCHNWNILSFLAENDPFADLEVVKATKSSVGGCFGIFLRPIGIGAFAILLAVLFLRETVSSSLLLPLSGAVEATGGDCESYTFRCDPKLGDGCYLRVFDDEETKVMSVGDEEDVRLCFGQDLTVSMADYAPGPQSPIGRFGDRLSGNGGQNVQSVAISGPTALEPIIDYFPRTENTQCASFSATSCIVLFTNSTLDTDSTLTVRAGDGAVELVSSKGISAAFNIPSASTPALKSITTSKDTLSLVIVAFCGSSLCSIALNRSADSDPLVPASWTERSHSQWPGEFPSNPFIYSWVTDSMIVSAACDGSNLVLSVDGEAPKVGFRVDPYEDYQLSVAGVDDSGNVHVAWSQVDSDVTRGVSFAVSPSSSSSVSEVSVCSRLATCDSVNASAPCPSGVCLLRQIDSLPLPSVREVYDSVWAGGRTNLQLVAAVTSSGSTVLYPFKLDNRRISVRSVDLAKSSATSVDAGRDSRGSESFSFIVSSIGVLGLWDITSSASNEAGVSQLLISTQVTPSDSGVGVIAYGFLDISPASGDSPSSFRAISPSLLLSNSTVSNSAGLLGMINGTDGVRVPVPTSTVAAKPKVLAKLLPTYNLDLTASSVFSNANTSDLSSATTSAAGWSFDGFDGTLTKVGSRQVWTLGIAPVRLVRVTTKSFTLPQALGNVGGFATAFTALCYVLVLIFRQCTNRTNSQKLIDTTNPIISVELGRRHSIPMSS